MSTETIVTREGWMVEGWGGNGVEGFGGIR